MCFPFLLGLIHQLFINNQFMLRVGSIRAEIGKYASQHGFAATAKLYSRKLGHKVSETTANFLKKAYLDGVREKRAAEDDGNVAKLPMKKGGRLVLLVRVRDGGGVVSARIAMAAARGILMSCNRSRLVEFGGDVQLNRQWAYSFLRRMNFVKRKATTAKSKHSNADFAWLKQQFLANKVTTVDMEEIPAELILINVVLVVDIQKLLIIVLIFVINNILFDLVLVN